MPVPAPASTNAQASRQTNTKPEMTIARCRRATVSIMLVVDIGGNAPGRLLSTVEVYPKRAAPARFCQSRWHPPNPFRSSGTPITSGPSSSAKPARSGWPARRRGRRPRTSSRTCPARPVLITGMCQITMKSPASRLVPGSTLAKSILPPEASPLES